MSKIYTSADQLIGHTPLLELTHIEAQENLSAKILKPPPQRLVIDGQRPCCTSAQKAPDCTTRRLNCITRDVL